jgi:hypothetical protein
MGAGNASGKLIVAAPEDHCRYPGLKTGNVYAIYVYEDCYSLMIVGEA